MVKIWFGLKHAILANIEYQNTINYSVYNNHVIGNMKKAQRKNITLLEILFKALLILLTNITINVSYQDGQNERKRKMRAVV